MSFSKTLEHIGNENTGWELWKICLSFSCVGTAYCLSHVLELRYNFLPSFKQLRNIVRSGFMIDELSLNILTETPPW